MTSLASAVLVNFDPQFANGVYCGMLVMLAINLATQLLLMLILFPRNRK